MEPKISFRDSFTNEGRLKKLWVRGLHEADPEVSLDLLRTVREQLQEHPGEFAHLWLPFLNSWLAPERVKRVSHTDLRAIEAMGQTLLQTTNRPHSPTPAEIWLRLVDAYDVRGETALAEALIIRICRNPTTNETIRSQCLNRLVQRGATNNQHLTLYLEYLQQTHETPTARALLAMLERFCVVDFSASMTQLTQVMHILQFLTRLNAESLKPHLHIAQGLYSLRVDQDPASALKAFEKAYLAERTNQVALAGCLVCWMRQAQFERVITCLQQAQQQIHLPNPIIGGLLDICLAIRWLEHPQVANTLPYDASRLQQISDLALHTYAGEVVHATLGRLWLLLGDTQAAMTAFDMLDAPLAQHPQWAYYAAWAALLAGKKAEAVSYFRETAGWSGHWTIANQLLDAYPTLAEECGALAFLRSSTETPGPVALALRQKLSGPHTLLARPENVEASLSVEEELELLRMNLASATALRERASVEQLIRQPLFIRLPLAEQLLWQGLLSLLHKNMEQGNLLLEKSAQSFGNQRAALFLGLQYLRPGNLKQARPYLEQSLLERSDQRSKLIQAYLNGQHRSLDETIQICEQLAVPPFQREVEAFLGNLYLYQAMHHPEQAHAYQLRAAQIWQQALKQEMPPGDLQVLAHCAAFIAYPGERPGIAHVLLQAWQKLERGQRQPWVGWHATLAVLWYGTIQEMMHASEDCWQLVSQASRLPLDAATALAQALLLIVRRIEQPEQASRLLSLFDLLEKQCAHPVIQRLCLTGSSQALAVIYRHASPEQRQQIEERVRQKLQQNPASEALTLFITCILLTQNKRADTAIILRRKTPQNPRLEYISRNLMVLLANQISGTNDIAYPEIEQIAGLALLQDTLRVVQAFTTGQTEQGFALLAQQQAASTLLVWKQERLLPAFTAYLLKNKYPLPAFCLQLPEKRPSAPGRKEAAAKNDPRTPYVSEQTRRALINLLCRQAVSASKTSEPLENVRKLKLAASLTNEAGETGKSRQQLLGLAHALELQIATTRLIASLFPDVNDPPPPAGRYQSLEQAIGDSPSLLTMLLNEEYQELQQEWSRTLVKQAGNVRFLHALSVLYREVALVRQTKQVVETNDWTVSTALWILLLSSETFWSYFAYERGGSTQHRRPALTPRQQEELWHDALERVLLQHSADHQARHGTGWQNCDRLHLACLALCWQGEKQLRATLQAHGLFCTIKITEVLLTRVQAYAKKGLEEWGTLYLAEAEQILKRPGANERSSGSDKNYQAAIQTLTPLLTLEVPVVSVLLRCLEWYNEWWYSLHATATQEELRALSSEAQEVAERLMPYGEKHKSSAPENQALALHLAYRAYSLVNAEEIIQAYEEARAWSPQAANVEELLEQAQMQLLHQQILAYAAQGAFTAAYQAIEQQTKYRKNTEALVKLHAQIILQQSQQLAQDGKYNEAWDCALRGKELDPQNTQIVQFLREMQELKPQEAYGLLLKEAGDELEQRNFEQALKLLTRIPRSSPLFKRALSLQISIYLQSAVDYADNNQLDNAEQQLRLAEGVDKTGEKRSLIQQQLSTILTRKAEEEIKRSRQMNVNTQKGQIKSRQIYAVSLLEEALELHAGNTAARYYLEELNQS